MAAAGNGPSSLKGQPTFGRIAASIVGYSSAIITVMTAVLFLSGRVYLGEYYNYFSVDITSLDLPIYYSLVVSILPMLASIKPFLLILTIALFIAIVDDRVRRSFWYRTYLGKRLSKRSRDHVDTPTWMTFAGTLSVVLSFIFIALTYWVISDVDGEKDAQAMFKQPRTKTTLTFKPDARVLLGKELLQINADGGLRLLVQTKDFVVVFVKRELQPSTRGAFVIPTANVVVVHNEALPVR